MLNSYPLNTKSFKTHKIHLETAESDFCSCWLMHFLNYTEHTSNSNRQALAAFQLSFLKIRKMWNRKKEINIQKKIGHTIAFLKSSQN
jgi:hypothetical protein